jgi:flagellin
MAAVLNTNAASLYASKNLQAAQSKMADSVERLSSGLRINRAKDDAAGLGISNALTQQINGANQGIRNLNDGISMVQTAEGAIAAAQEMAQRILTLATQGANGTMGASEKKALRAEMRQLMVAINSIGDRTKFSGNSLLAGTTVTLQVSNVTTDTITLTGTSAFKKLGVSAGSLVNSDILSDTVETAYGTSGSQQASDLLIVAIDSQTDANIADLSFTNIMTRAGTYIADLSTQRSLLGAYQNQIEFSVSNLNELSSNLSAARSNVQDTDYASETASLTKGQILQQAATAMLAQANQMPNVILSLLK